MKHFTLTSLLLLLLVEVYMALSLSPCPRCGICRCCTPEPEAIAMAPKDSHNFTVLILNCTHGVARGSNGKVLFPDSSHYLDLGAKGKTVHVWATFRYNQLTTVQRMELSSVSRLDLSDNRIRILYDNAFASMRSLQRLSLARNQLSSFRKTVFSNFPSLERLDISQNKLTLLETDMFPVFNSLLIFNASGNALSDFPSDVVAASMPKLEVLDLSYNRLTNLGKGSLPNLRELYLAGNMIKSIEAYPIITFKSLQRMDVSSNGLFAVQAIGLTSLRQLHCGRNLLSDVRQLLGAFPRVELVDLSANNVTSLQGLDWKYLQELDVSDNPLSSLPDDMRAPNLTRLDLSGCNFETPPVQLEGRRLPHLRSLFMDRCTRMRSLSFTSNAAFPKLRLLSASYLPRLEEVSAGALEGLLAPRSNRTELEEDLEENDGCSEGTLELHISHNERLVSVHRDAFKGLPLCKLDLSNNALEWLEQSTADWNSLRWADLQFNPWNCVCNMQWLVDVLTSRLYHTGYEELLYELRCANPAVLRDRRLVHFLNWTQKALCESWTGRMAVAPGDGDAGAGGGGIAMSGVSIALLVAIGLGALLLVLVMTGLIITVRRKRAERVRNRRF